MNQTREISLPVGYKSARPKQETGNDYDVILGLEVLGKLISPTFPYFLINNALLYHFLANLLAHKKKMTEISLFREASSPEMTSQSFPVSCFWSRAGLWVAHRMSRF